MLINLRATTPRAFFYLMGYALSIKLIIAIIFYFFYSDTAINPDFVVPLKPLISLPIGLLILTIQASWLNNILKSIPFIEERTFYVPAIYLLITSLSIQLNVVSAPLLLNFVLIGIIAQLVRLSFNESAKQENFLMGFLMGFWIIFQPSVIFLIPFLMVSIYLLKPFRVNEFILLLLGAFLPTYFTLSVAYVFGIQLPPSFNPKLLGIYQPDFSWTAVIPIILMIVFSLFTLLNYRTKFNKSSTFQKRLSSALSISYIGIIVAIVLSLSNNWSILIYLMPIASIFIAIYLLRISNKITAEIIHVIFVLIILLSQILNVFK